MVNANRLACELDALFPRGEVPECTEGYEGFFHLCDLRGSVEECLLHYIIRDHDRARFEARKRFAAEAAKTMDARYGAGTVEVKIVDSYYNMREVMEAHMDVIHRAEEACRAVGVEQRARPSAAARTAAGSPSWACPARTWAPAASTTTAAMN